MIRVVALAALLALGALSACAPGGGDAVARPSVGAAVTYGTVVGVRPATPRGGDWHARLLAGLGGTAGNRAATGSRAVEFIVREDGGRDIATVRTNEDGLRMGERVAIIRGGGTRLARASGGTSGRPSGVRPTAPAEEEPDETRAALPGPGLG